MNINMKTITLDDEAYRRLKSWKRSAGDSFSKVVKRVVPEAGTLGALARFVEERSAIDSKQDVILEETIGDRSKEKADPWN
jgi:predicted CopG family antitoxin